MGTLTGDYIGFTYNNVPSSDLGIVRISEGSRFNENLLPITQDKTVQVPGGDGSYYFGSYYVSKQFNVSYAFDSLTEQQFARLSEVFGDKKIHPLIFDERPYKAYYAKVTGTSSIKHIPFNEGSKNRVYKGEGNLQFTAFQPYAVCTKKFLDDPYYSKFTNIEEWKDASGLLDTQGRFDSLNNFSGELPLYNPGNLEADFSLTIKFNKFNEILAGKISIKDESLRQLKWKTFNKRGNDFCVKINSKNNLIEGYTEDGRKTGNIYNDAIIAGTFFKIPMNEQGKTPSMILSDFGGVDSNWTNIFPSNEEKTVFYPIEYNYYYF